MKATIEWNEKLAEGGRRIVRVSLTGRSIKWQFKLTTEDRWDYDTKPSAEDWDMLLKELDDRYQRGRIPPEPIRLAKKGKSEAGFGG